MDVVCPACKKTHHVKEQMVGKRAKCGCGEVMTIARPVADWQDDGLNVPLAPAGDAPLEGLQSQTRNDAAQSDAVLFQCRYGVFRPWMWWLMGANFVIGVVAIAIGLFWNTGWSINNARLPPWSATVMFECVGVGLVLMFVWFVVGHFVRRNNPQRVAVTASGVILPKGHWSTAERVVPWQQVHVRLMSSGPVQQLQFKQGWRSLKILVSVQFDNDDDFETLLEYMVERGKL